MIGYWLIGGGFLVGCLFAELEETAKARKFAAKTETERAEQASVQKFCSFMLGLGIAGVILGLATFGLGDPGYNM